MNHEDALTDAQLLRQAADNLIRHIMDERWHAARGRVEIIRIYAEGLKRYLDVDPT